MKKQNLWGGYGGLGADIDREEVIARRAVRSKVADFSFQLRSINRGQMVPKSDGCGIRAVPEKERSSREKAIEFAKSIPKPKRVFPLCSFELEADSPNSERVAYIGALMEQHGEMELLVRRIKTRNDL